MPAPLAYAVSADITKFESAMSRARDVALQRSTDMLRSFQSTAAGINTAFTGIQALGRLPGTLDRAKTAALGLASAGAVILGSYALVSAAIGQANDQLDRFTKLGANAEKAGVGVELFQRFSEAAEKAKLDIKAIEAALLQAGKIVTPKFEESDQIRSRLSDLFETGYLGDRQSQGLDDYRKANTNEDRIRAAVRAMQELQQAGERLAAIDLAERLFGADVAERIRSGRLEIDAIADSLDRKREDLISQQQVQQAEEFRDRLDAAYKALDNALHVSVALEGSGRSFLNTWLAILEVVAAAATKASTFADRMAAGIRAASASPLPATPPLSFGGRTEGQGSIAADLGAEAGRQQRGRTLYDSPIGPDRPSMSIENPPEPPRRPLSFYTDQREAAPARGGAETQSLDQIETFINGVEKATAGLKGEVEAIGLSNTERQVSINLRRAEQIALQQNRQLTTGEIDRIKQASAAMAEYREKIEDAREAQQFLRSSGGEFLTGFAQDVRSGVSAIDALNNAVSRLAARLEDKALNTLADMLFGKSGGTSSGLFGSAFGGSGGFDVGLNFFGGGAANGRVPGYASGRGALVAPSGIVSGPGTGTSDSILARISNREAIIRASSVQHYGPDFIKAINDRTFGLPGFADGYVPMMPVPSAATRSGGGGLEVNIQNAPAQAKVSETSGPRGRRLDIEFEDMVGGMIAGGRFDKQLSSRFGVRATGR